jgi:hypothetical protein
MFKPSLQLIGEASRIRELARSVRHLATTLSLEGDKELLRRHAQDMEEQADRLQAQASAPSVVRSPSRPEPHA